MMNNISLMKYGGPRETTLERYGNSANRLWRGQVLTLIACEDLRAPGYEEQVHIQQCLEKVKDTIEKSFLSKYK